MLGLNEVMLLHRRFDPRLRKIKTISLLEMMKVLRSLTGQVRANILVRHEAHEVGKRGAPEPYADCCVVKWRSVTFRANRRSAGECPRYTPPLMTWGQVIEPPYLLLCPESKGWTLYVAVWIEETLGSEFFTWEGDPISLRQIAPYLKPPAKRRREEVGNESRYRLYDATSVLAIFLPDPLVDEVGYVIDARQALEIELDGGKPRATCLITPTTKVERRRA